MSTKQHGSLQSALIANISEARQKAADDVPEISADEILESFKRELRYVTVDGFGAVYYYHPISVAEHLAINSKIGADGALTASGIVDAIIAHARNKDGSLKFNASHAAQLMEAPTAPVLRLANALIRTHKITLASAQKK